MASLIETLITTLEEESELYEALTKESMAKTPAIVANDLAKLTEANTREQAIVDKITAVSHRRDNILTEIATVLSKDAKTITVSEVIQTMGKQPEFQHPLIDIKSRLLKQVETLRQISIHNRDLLQESLEMTEYSINLIQSLNQAPETANYSGANYNGSTLGNSNSSFDTKQ
ncbi:MAG: flagellar protein FlgN [Lachnospiraceae bacterium]|nr:flagellar protein FlgN [Lachnospiraceae bacterium]MDE6625159.1 flagellar protein FlgN [Lachnospiraceae bacterium]